VVLDVSGAPGGSNCTQCHSGGSFATITQITIEDLAGNTVSNATVEGDSTYKITVTVTAGSGSPSGYGFQFSALEDSTDTSVGTFSNTATGVRTFSLTNRQVVEHSVTSGSGVFTFNWTAPSSVPGGTVTLYAYGNAVNGNSAVSGDFAAGTNATLTLTPAVGTPTSVRQLAAQLSINLFPNPAINDLTVQLEAEEANTYQVQIVAANGQTVAQQTLDVAVGQNQSTIDVSDLAVGSYYVVLQDANGNNLSRPFLKF